jgi:malonyl-CoA/methylmalonyl-CoA synthetase
MLAVGPEAWQQHLVGRADLFNPTDLGSSGTLLAVWDRHWRDHPGATVLIDGSDRTSELSAEALATQTSGAAAVLVQRGVSPGDRVLWSCSPSLPSIVALLGVLRLGAVLVPVSPAMTERELRYVVHDATPSAALLERPEHAGWIDSAATSVLMVGDLVSMSDGLAPPNLDAALPGDDALIVYTSGTTGRPKGAIHTHGSLLAGVRSLQVAWGWEPDDHLILTLPLFHVHGLCAGLFGTLTAGASAVVFDRFSLDVVLGAAPVSTMFFGVPTMYHRLAESGRAGALAYLRLCVSGSAPLSADLWHRLHRVDGIEVLERYGMSETLLTISNPLVGERRPGSVGLPLPGVECFISDVDEQGVGELMVRGPSLCRGYWGKAEASASLWTDGWLATGDLASVGDGGYVTIRGRRTELIITGGHNVYPAEVEGVLARHPSVGEIAVVGVPSAEWGESVVAYVVGAQGAPDIDGLTAMAARELAPFKRPRQFRVVDALPRNAMGKVVRRELQ